MEVTDAVSTEDFTDSITDMTTTMIGINSTTDRMPAMMNNYTTTTELQLSTAFVAFYYVLKFIFSGFAIFGNTLTIMAAFRFESLRTTTNFLICSLAVADLLGCATAPVNLAHDILSDEPIFVPLCLIHRAMGTISVCMNFFSILGIAIDRYLFIAHPFRYPLWVTSTRIYTFIGITWSFVITEITAMTLSHQLTVGVPCTFSLFLPKLVYWILFVPQVIILQVLTIAFYVAIGRIAYKQGKAIAALNQHYDTYEASLNRQQKKIAKMMVTVLGTYFACIMPMGIGEHLRDALGTTFWLHYEKVAALIYWGNLWLNPLIYGWKSEDFRVAFRKLLGLKPAAVGT